MSFNNPPQSRKDFVDALDLHIDQFRKYHKYPWIDLEIRSVLEEILQAIVWEVRLEMVSFPELWEDSRQLMKELDGMIWGYMVIAGDSSGAKQILRDKINDLYKNR